MVSELELKEIIGKVLKEMAVEGNFSKVMK